MNALLVRVVLFAAFLLPITIGEFSVNYAFLLYALFLALQKRRIEKPNVLMLVAIAVYGAIYLVGLGFDIFAPDAYLLRRAMSFAIFMTIFAFVPVSFGALETRALKIAIVAVSFGFSLYAITRFFSVGGNSFGFALKDVTGSQRYGFVYLLAIFCLMTISSTERWFRVGRALVLFVILAGLLLTFSRASIISLGCVLPLFLLAPLVTKVGERMGRFSATGRRVGTAALYSVMLFVVFPVSFHYYGDLILSRYVPVFEESFSANGGSNNMGGAASADDLVFVPEGSEGTRIRIWKAIITHTLDHPLTGSSYLGAWRLDGINTGSSHSQYFDVLLRTGFPGMLIYLLILSQILLFLWRKEPSLFWGVLAMLVFGLFHETFKESQGAFILACLLGMYSADRRLANASAQVSTKPAPVRV